MADAGPTDTHSLKDAFAFVRRNKVVAGVLLIDIMPMLFAYPKGLYPALATEQFHGGAVAFGLLSAAAGVGAFLAAALSGRVTKTARPGVVVIIAAGMWGAAMVGVALSPWLVLGLVFLALSGASDLVSEVLRTGLLQNHTPDRLRGRVTSLWLAQATVSPALGQSPGRGARGAVGAQRRDPRRRPGVHHRCGRGRLAASGVPAREDGGPADRGARGGLAGDRGPREAVSESVRSLALRTPVWSSEG